MEQEEFKKEFEAYKAAVIDRFSLILSQLDQSLDNIEQMSSSEGYKEF
jgi:hypothetical protein